MCSCAKRSVHSMWTRNSGEASNLGSVARFDCFALSAACAKTSGTRRAKPAADPWQALPRLAYLFDSQTPQPFFKGSKVSALEELALTETKLLEQTASILGVSLAQLVKAGTLVYAKREFLNHQKYSAAEGGDYESALLRSGSGVAGVADARILAAYQAMAGANPPIPITPAKLRIFPGTKVMINGARARELAG
jgi:hypothetical protein